MASSWWYSSPPWPRHGRFWWRSNYGSWSVIKQWAHYYFEDKVHVYSTTSETGPTIWRYGNPFFISLQSQWQKGKHICSIIKRMGIHFFKMIVLSCLRTKFVIPCRSLKGVKEVTYVKTSSMVLFVLLASKVKETWKHIYLFKYMIM